MLLRVLQADVQQTSPFLNLYILQWSTPSLSYGANHLLLSARCYWKTPADSALRNGSNGQHVVVVVGCCCCLGSGLVAAQGMLLLEQLSELRREDKAGVTFRRHLMGLEGRD